MTWVRITWRRDDRIIASWSLISSCTATVTDVIGIVGVIGANTAILAREGGTEILKFAGISQIVRATGAHETRIVVVVIARSSVLTWIAVTMIDYFTRLAEKLVATITLEIRVVVVVAARCAVGTGVCYAVIYDGAYIIEVPGRALTREVCRVISASAAILARVGFAVICSLARVASPACCTHTEETLAIPWRETDGAILTGVVTARGDFGKAGWSRVAGACAIASELPKIVVITHPVVLTDGRVITTV